MSSKTPNIELVKQAGTEYGDYEIMNANLDKIDDEMGKRGKTVNGKSADSKGNYQVDEVQFARQLVTDDAQQSSGEYQFRTTGGDASLTDGDAKLVRILGRSTHTGIVAESLSMTVTPAQREEGEEAITAEIDRDTFVAYVDQSGTITLTYTDAWSANPSLYGVTVTGDPVSGDQIVIVYVKANRGLITNSAPTRFISTGWNLYDHSATYARVKKYSTTYGFLVGGSYSALKFSETLTGSKTTITPVSGAFTIPSDGYVWVTDGDSTTTYILMTWSDWTSGYEGSWKAYAESIVDFTTVAGNAFPIGMMQVGGYADELDFGLGKAISRIERMVYSAENLASVRSRGLPYDCDEDYIYAVRTAEVTTDIAVSGDHTACDHGEEIVEGGTIAPFIQTIYGENLVDKLRTDVVTKSTDLVNGFTETGTGKALDARAGKTLNEVVNKILPVISGTTNNSGYPISSGEYFEANGKLYKATASIPTGNAWSSSATEQSDHGAVNALSNNLTNLGKLVFKSTFTTITSGSSIEILPAKVGGGIVVLRYYGPNIDKIKAYGVYRQNQYAQTISSNMMDTAETSENKSLSYSSSGQIMFKNVHSSTVEKLDVLFLMALV